MTAGSRPSASLLSLSLFLLVSLALLENLPNNRFINYQVFVSHSNGNGIRSNPYEVKSELLKAKKEKQTDLSLSSVRLNFSDRNVLRAYLQRETTKGPLNLIRTQSNDLKCSLRYAQENFRFCFVMSSQLEPCGTTSNCFRRRWELSLNPHCLPFTSPINKSFLQTTLSVKKKIPRIFRGFVYKP